MTYLNDSSVVTHILMTYLETHELPGLPSGLMVFLCIFGTIWLFVAIAIICDDFFVPSLEAISEAGFQINTFLSFSDWLTKYRVILRSLFELYECAASA